MDRSGDVFKGPLANQCEIEVDPEVLGKDSAIQAKSGDLTCLCDRCLIRKDYENFKKRKFGDVC
jgi:hypothetical protein